MTKPKSSSDKLKDDFCYFMAALWKEMGLPKPTRMQMLFADTLQKSPARKLALLGYRGFAKTYIACAYSLWQLYKQPNQQIAFWGSNQDNAGDSTQLMLRWIKDISWLKHLAPDGDMDSANLSFDVKGRGIFRGSSVMAFGVGGSVTGTRADYLVVDDPETSSNGDTAKKRISIDRAMAEATYVIKDAGRILVLGTIHFDDSLYTRLMNKGYTVYLFPMAVPSLETQKACWDYYLPPVRKLITEREIGSPLDRFTESEILLKRQEGELSFERQCLVNPFRTSLSYKPLNLRKIIIFPADKEELPIRFFHGEIDEHIDNEAMSFSSASMVDKLYAPYKWDSNTKKYDYKVAWIDPAGSGKDETSLTVCGVSGGYMVCFHSEGMMGGSTEENLENIIRVARQYDVNQICVEDQFGSGMFAQLLSGTYAKMYGRFGGLDTRIPVTTEKCSTQKSKEKRILQALDPIVNFGRLIMTKDCLVVDYESALKHTSEDKMAYRLTYQLSYFSENGNQLLFDDRIDGLAGCVEKLKAWMTDLPQMQAEDYEYYLEQKMFEEDQTQFDDPTNPTPTPFTVDWGDGAIRQSFLR